MIDKQTPISKRVDKNRSPIESLENTEKPKVAKESSLESEEFDTILLKYAPMPVVMTNLDGSIRYVNPAQEALTGYPSAEVKGLKPPFPWWPAENRLEYGTNLSHFARGNTSKDEHYFRKKNGEMFWAALNVREVALDGQPRFYLSSWTDITDAKRNEEKIRESEKRFHELADLLPVIAFEANLKGEIIYVNDHAFFLFGYAREEFMGRPIYGYIALEDREKGHCQFTKSINQ